MKDKSITHQTGLMIPTPIASGAARASAVKNASCFGEIFSFMLPHTHIVAQGAFKMFTRANGDEKDFNGIRPDIEVTISAKDIPAKQDVVLDKAIAWVLQ